MLRDGYKPRGYARKDRHGQPVLLEQRAEATADYLEHSHWSATSPPEHQAALNRVAEELQKRTQRHAHLQYDVNKVSIAELRIVLQKLKGNKAPGPDRITTDFLKDLDEDNLQAMLELVNQWWEQGQIPHEILRAKVTSLYKKGGPQPTGQL